MRGRETVNTARDIKQMGVGGDSYHSQRQLADERETKSQGKLADGGGGGQLLQPEVTSRREGDEM